MNDGHSMQSDDVDRGVPSSPATASLSVPKNAQVDRKARGVAAVFVALLAGVLFTVAAARGAVALSVSSIVVVGLAMAVTWLYGIHKLLFGDRNDTAQLATSVVVSVFSMSCVAFALGALGTTVLRPPASIVVDVSACKDTAASGAVVVGLDPRAPTMVLVHGQGPDGARGASIVEQHVRSALREHRGLLQEVPTEGMEQDVVARAISDALRASTAEVFTTFPRRATVEASVLALHGNRLVNANVGGMRVGIVRGGQWSDLSTPTGERIGANDDVEVELAALDLVDGDTIVVIADGTAVPVPPDGFDVVALAEGHAGAAVLRFHPMTDGGEAPLPLSCSSSTMSWSVGP
jgi:hypothetical protein